MNRKDKAICISWNRKKNGTGNGIVYGMGNGARNGMERGMGWGMVNGVRSKTGNGIERERERGN